MKLDDVLNFDDITLLLIVALLITMIAVKIERMFSTTPVKKESDKQRIKRRIKEFIKDDSTH